MSRIFIVVLFILINLFIACNNNQVKNNNTESKKSLTDSSLTIELLNEKIRQNPRDEYWFVKRANLYLKNNQTEEALNDLSIASHLDSLNPDIYLQLANVQLKLGRSGKTKATLEKCLRYNPENTDAMLHLANLYFYVKDYTKAMEWINKTQKVDRNIPNLYFIKGMIYKENKDTDLAIRNFQIAVEKEPDYYDAYIFLGLLYADRNDSLAIAYYKNAMRIYPLSMEVHYNLAMFYQENNRENDAIREYDYILNNIDSLQPNIYYNQAYVYMYNIADYNKAIQLYSKAIAINNKFVSAIYNRGFCYEMLKEYSKAKADYIRSLELYDNYELAIDGLNRIDKVNTN